MLSIFFLLAKLFITTNTSKFHPKLCIDRTEWRDFGAEKNIEKKKLRSSILTYPLACSNIVFGYKIMIGTHE